MADKVVNTKSIVLLFICVCLGMVIFTSRSFYPAPQQSSQSDTVSQPQLSRAELLNTCQSCHKEVQHNESMGPHAHAYKTLLAHKEYVNQKEYSFAQYTKFVNNSLEKLCSGCHAPENIFETVFAGLEFLPVSELKSVPTQTFFNPITLRSDTASRLTGIDCLTCHYNGKDILASQGFTGKEEDKAMPGYCFPKPSALLSSDLLCASCHKDNFKDKEDFASLTSLNCNGCHLQAKEGNLAHHYYWKHDEDKENAGPYFSAILNDLTVEKSGQKINIAVSNKSIPHPFNVCMETIFQFDVVNDKEEIVASELLKLNRKPDHLKTLDPKAGVMDVPGVEGKRFEYNGDKLLMEIAVPSKQKADKVYVSVLSKGQYWHNDTTGNVTFRKEIPLGEKVN